MSKNDTDNLIRIYAKDQLSRRKARKLAWVYRGSRRGQLYQDWLDGKNRGQFYPHNRRLKSYPRVGNVTVVTTMHPGKVSANARALYESMTAGMKYSAEDPPERVLVIEDLPEIRPCAVAG